MFDRADAVQEFGGREQPVADRSQAPLNYAGRRERLETAGEVGLTTAQIDETAVGQYLDGQFRMVGCEPRNRYRQGMRRKPFRRGYLDGTGDVAARSCPAAVEGERR